MHKRLFKLSKCLFLIMALIGWPQSGEATAQIPSPLGHQSSPRNSFQTLLDEVNQRIDRLENSIAKRDRSDLATINAQISVDVSRQFVKFAKWDDANQDSLAKTLGQWRPVHSDRNRLASQLARNELNDCKTILDRAQQELDSNKERIRWSAETNFEDLRMVEGYFRNGERPSFPFGIFRAPTDLPKSFGTLSFVYVHPAFLNRSRPAINSGQAQWFRSQLDRIAADGRNAYLFLGHEPPSWEQANSIQTGQSRHILYNIDHPNPAIWWRGLMDGLGNEFAQHPASLDFAMLANEPHWFSTNTLWGHVDLSSVTLEKFQQWLKSRHESIDQLNACWKTSHTHFEQISFELPLKNEQQGSGLWYDWCRFNMDRGMEFFHMLDSEVKRSNPSSLNHVKTPSQLFLDTQHDHGIDWYRMAQELGMLGIDSTLTSNQGIFEFEKTERQNRYSIDWVQSVAAIDLMKSICPDKPMIDLEWHGISSIHWRDTQMTSDYVRTGLWLNYLAGLAIHQSWYWSREADGAPSELNQEEFYGSFLTQPVALDSYLHTMTELNQHSDQIVDIARRRPVIGLLYCEDSAIQDQQYLTKFSEVYQALKFTGLPFRIVPVRQIADPDQQDSLKEFQTMVIPPTKYIERKLFKVIEEKLQRVPNVIQVGDENFLMDVYGNRLVESKAMKRSRSIQFSNAESIFNRIVDALSDELKKNRSDLVVEPVWGLLQYSTGSKPNRVKVLINVSPNPIRVLVKGSSLAIDPMETIVIAE